MTVPSNLIPVTISNLPIATTPQGTDLTIIVQDGSTKRTNIAAFVGAVAVPSTRIISSGTGLAGGGDLSADRNIYIANTGVTSGTFGSSSQVPILTINAQGQITNVSTSSFSVAFNNITGTPTTLAGYGITDAQPYSVNLQAFSNLASTGLVVRDGIGSVISRSLIAGTGMTVSNGDGISGNPTVALTNTAVSPGTYGSSTSSPVFTVNQQGQITSSSSAVITPQWSSITSTPTTLSGYGITDAVPITRTVTGLNSVSGGGALSGNISLSLLNDVLAPGVGKYYGTDGSGTRGWYTSSGGGTVTQINTGTGLTGGPITSSGTISINTTGVTAAAYGSSTSIPSFTVNAQGQLTAAAGNAVIAPAGTLSGTTLNSTVTLSSLTKVGTITLGTWNGTVVAGQYGGTGVANTGKTITLGGNLTTSGAFTTTLTATANTSVTLPTSGTLVNTTVATLSSLSSIGTITTGTWNGTVIAGQYGGTGVANTGKTITLGGNLTTSGAFATTLTTTGTTSLTLPTTGTVTALGNATIGSGSIVLNTSTTLVTPNLGTPTSVTLTNATGLPISTGVSGLGTGVATFLATPTYTNLSTAVTGDTVVGAAAIQTLTNKRVTPRVSAISANSPTPALNTDDFDMMVITAQSAAITSFTMTGTPTNGQKLWISITGIAAVALTFGASFEASTVALPTTTVTTNRLDIGFVWNVATSKWRCVATA
jgi:hypothetical protein